MGAGARAGLDRVVNALELDHGTQGVYGPDVRLGRTDLTFEPDAAEEPAARAFFADVSRAGGRA